MTAVILTFHVLIVLALIGLVLMQRSEGGALGMGGGGAGGGFMSGRGAANALTRTTSVLAAIFFATSLGLAVIAGSGEDAEDVIDELTGDVAPVETDGLGVPTTEDLLNTLGGAAADAATPEDGQLPTEQDLLDSLGAPGADAPAADTQASDQTEETPDESGDPDQ